MLFNVGPALSIEGVKENPSKIMSGSYFHTWVHGDDIS